MEGSIVALAGGPAAEAASQLKLVDYSIHLSWFLRRSSGRGAESKFGLFFLTTIVKSSIRETV